jgi:hypothetical protein
VVTARIVAKIAAKRSDKHHGSGTLISYGGVWRGRGCSSCFRQKRLRVDRGVARSALGFSGYSSHARSIRPRFLFWMESGVERRCRANCRYQCGCSIWGDCVAPSWDRNSYSKRAKKQKRFMYRISHAPQRWPVRLMCPPNEEKECIAAAQFIGLFGATEWPLYNQVVDRVLAEAPRSGLYFVLHSTADVDYSKLRHRKMKSTLAEGKVTVHQASVRSPAAVFDAGLPLRKPRRCETATRRRTDGQ